jgi:hypothetical protein
MGESQGNSPSEASANAVRFRGALLAFRVRQPYSNPMPRQPIQYRMELLWNTLADTGKQYQT